jgi:uncharacterized protein (TIGR00290 family)
MRALLSWSGGKDAAFALHEVRKAGSFDVVGLLTTVSEASGRVAMHGVRGELLERQAVALELPLVKVRLPQPSSNADYEHAMEAVLGPLREQGIHHVIFGDLFLEDIREYRESRLRSIGFEPVFPLWGRETSRLARAMIRAGIDARICCLDPRQLDPSFAGRRFDLALLQDLPASVDPCGERGEFHTFVAGAPEYRAPISIRLGERTTRDGFVYVDMHAD